MSERLELKAVSIAYPTRGDVVRDVSLIAAAGETIALVGASGAGKSTLLRAVARLHEPSGGCIKLGSHDLYGPRARQRFRGAIGFVHQQHAIPASLTVAMAVLGGKVHDWSAFKVLATAAAGPSGADVERAALVLDRVGLSGSEHERVGELSVGQRQRVAVARTLLQSPRLIVADEPVASVDSQTASLVLDLLAEEAARGAIVVCSLHDARKALDHFHRVVGLHAGRITFDAPSSGLTQSQLGEVCLAESA